MGIIRRFRSLVSSRSRRNSFDSETASFESYASSSLCSSAESIGSMYTSHHSSQLPRRYGRRFSRLKMPLTQGRDHLEADGTDGDSCQPFPTIGNDVSPLLSPSDLDDGPVTQENEGLRRSMSLDNHHTTAEVVYPGAYYPYRIRNRSTGLECDVDIAPWIEREPYCAAPAEPLRCGQRRPSRVSPFADDSLEPHALTSENAPTAIDQIKRLSQMIQFLEETRDKLERGQVEEPFARPRGVRASDTPDEKTPADGEIGVPLQSDLDNVRLAGLCDSRTVAPYYQGIETDLMDTVRAVCGQVSDLFPGFVPMPVRLKRKSFIRRRTRPDDSPDRYFDAQCDWPYGAC